MDAEQPFAAEEPLDILESEPRRPGRRLMAVGLIGAGVVAGGTLATLGVASANSAGGSQQAAAQPSATASGAPRVWGGDRDGRGRGRLGAEIHGSETVQTGTNTFVTVDTQRGTVTANDGTTITVRSADGFTASYSTSAQTLALVDGAKASVAGVKVGDTVSVRALAAASGPAAASVIVDGLGAGRDGFGPGFGDGQGPDGVPPTGAPTGGTTF